WREHAAFSSGTARGARVHVGDLSPPTPCSELPVNGPRVRQEEPAGHRTARGAGTGCGVLAGSQPRGRTPQLPSNGLDLECWRAPAADACCSLRQRVGSWGFGWADRPLQRAGSAMSRTASLAPEPVPKTLGILVIDDDRVSGRSLCRALAKLRPSYAVELSTSSEMAISRLSSGG